MDAVWRKIETVLITALKKEIEVYKAYPKRGKYNIDSFDPRTTDQCFMGQGFQANGSGLEGWYDGDLNEYRAAVGRIDHSAWGHCTLLEIWGGDHFTNYKDMVVGVMRYCWGELKECPEIKFHINPLFKNDKSGKMIPSTAMKADRMERKRIEMIAAYSEVKLWMKKHRTTNPLGFEMDDVTDDDIRNIPNDDDDEDF